MLGGVKIDDRGTSVSFGPCLPSRMVAWAGAVGAVHGKIVLAGSFDLVSFTYVVTHRPNAIVRMQTFLVLAGVDAVMLLCCCAATL